MSKVMKLYKMTCKINGEPWKREFIIKSDKQAVVEFGKTLKELLDASDSMRVVKITDQRLFKIGKQIL